VYVPFQGSVRHSITLSHCSDQTSAAGGPHAISLFHTPVAIAVATPGDMQEHSGEASYMHSYIQGFCVHYTTDVTIFYSHFIAMVTQDLMEVTQSHSNCPQQTLFYSTSLHADLQ
jgi:hypothetical protein